MLTTHYSLASAVLVVKAAPNAVMSLIWLPQRLQGHFVNNNNNNNNNNNKMDAIKSQHADNLL